MPTSHTAQHTLPCLVRYGDQREDITAATNEAEWYAMNARNALRHLTFGTPILYGRTLRKANLKLLWVNLLGLLVKRNQKILDALHQEMQQMLIAAHEALKDPALSQEIKKRYDIFIHTFISNLPFLNPEAFTTIQIPQKIADTFELITYRYRKIDLSPKKGLFGKLMTNQQRLYAYGLEPIDQHGQILKNVAPILLVMGTTYPAGQGAMLSVLGDVTYGQSVGERHSLDEVTTWLQTITKQTGKKALVTGHSQGGTMAMLIAGTHTTHIATAHCLNPAALHRKTIARLKQNWETCDAATRPTIQVYTQHQDPVFSFGDGLLPGTRVTKITRLSTARKKSFSGKLLSPLKAHAQHFCSQPDTVIEEDIPYLANNRHPFKNKFKAANDVLLTTLLSLKLAYALLAERLASYKIFGASLTLIAGIAICLALSATGFGAIAGIALLSAMMLSMLSANDYPILKPIERTLYYTLFIPTIALIGIWAIGSACYAKIATLATRHEANPPSPPQNTSHQQIYQTLNLPKTSEQRDDVVTKPAMDNAIKNTLSENLDGNENLICDLNVTTMKMKG